jgi:hypothetical protein
MYSADRGFRGLVGMSTLPICLGRTDDLVVQYEDFVLILDGDQGECFTSGDGKGILILQPVIRRLRSWVIPHDQCYRFGWRVNLTRVVVPLSFCERNNLVLSVVRFCIDTCVFWYNAPRLLGIVRG